jgi:hypothetical protein
MVKEASAKDKNFALGLLGCDIFAGDEVHEVTESCHGDDNANIAPFVAVVVAVYRIDVVVPAHIKLAGTAPTASQATFSELAFA